MKDETIIFKHSGAGTGFYGGTYRTSQHQTSGTNEADNTQIVSEMYEVFAKENARAASQANYQEGKALNEKYYSDSHSDWTYYNSDYYYQCNETNAALRESVKQMIEKSGISLLNFLSMHFYK